MRKITDIDVFTLEHVLKNCKLLDLFQVASANQHFRKACRLEFARRYSKKEFILSLIEIVPEYCDEGDSQIIVYGLKFILQFLRIFGEFVKKVKLSFPLDDCLLSARRIIEYLCFYCATSIQKITIQNVYFDIFQFVDKSFPNVNEIVIVSCNVRRNFHETVAFFPNIQTIEFSGWNAICGCLVDCRCIFEGCCFYQALENLGVVVLHDQRGDKMIH